MLTNDSELLFFQNQARQVDRTCSKVRVHPTKHSELFQFLSEFIDLSARLTILLNSYDHREIENLYDSSIENLVNLTLSNEIPELVSFLTIVNQKLPMGGILVGSVETIEQRKKRFMAALPRQAAYFSYLIDFVLARIFPKFCLTQNLSNFIAADRNRAMSLTETLGQLVYCGFQIVGHKEIQGQTHYIARKTAHPMSDKRSSSGLIIKLKRLGQNGKLISVYKLRTMHPYAEYIQEYVCRKHSLKAGGKFDKDFRITSWGRFLRKYWIDELPMIINLLKGDLKLVGVRPLSPQYEGLYCEDLRMQRRRHKPGLFPPFYADLPTTLEEIMESERRYLSAYEKSPFQTDIRYFCKAFYNIVVRRSRSG
jgi:lipopolysaccharide/colanic/teichoic acid biosynthesis glycosyltransferase